MYYIFVEYINDKEKLTWKNLRRLIKNYILGFQWYSDNSFIIEKIIKESHHPLY